MTSPRAIASLSLIAVLMLLAAIWLTAGAPSATLAVPSVSGLSMPSLPSIAWPDGGLQAPPPAVVAAFAAGWMARWL